MAVNFAESVFPPFPFTSRSVPIVSDNFDFAQWKRDPAGPVILKGILRDWPIVQDLKRCGTDDARLDFLSRGFGSAVVGYTKVPASDPFMGYDENGRENFEYAPGTCKLDEFCGLLRKSLQDRRSDIFYARGGANELRTWRKFSQSIRPLGILTGMKTVGEGIWLGSGRHISHLHQDAHFNCFAMITGVKRVLLYPLEAIADLYPSPFYGGISGITSSFVRPRTPDPQRFPRFMSAAKHAWVAVVDEGDVLCLPPCWWHYVEAAPGLNLMINTFMWALPPAKVRQFEVMMRRSITTALTLSTEELSGVRKDLYQEVARGTGNLKLSASARALRRRLSRFLQPDIPGYWQKIARCYYDHYVFQINGHPVAAYPERHATWARQEASLKPRFRHWARFIRGRARMIWRRRMVTGIVP